MENPTGSLYFTPARGWLLVFCCVLLFVIPYFLLKSSLTLFHISDAIKTAYPRIENVSLVFSFISVGTLLLSLRAGYRLWVVSSGAVVTAKRFLVIFWATSLILALLPFTVGLPPATTSAMQKTFLWGLARDSAYCGLWWLYLHRSRRVRSLYGSHPTS
jgi:hypothetical protein